MKHTIQKRIDFGPVINLVSCLVSVVGGHLAVKKILESPKIKNDVTKSLVASAVGSVIILCGYMLGEMANWSDKFIVNVGKEYVVDEDDSEE